MKSKRLIVMRILMLCIGACIIVDSAAHGDDAPTTAAAVSAAGYSAESRGTRKLVHGPVWIKMLADASNLGRDDIEVGELFLPVEYGEGDAHQHGSLEIFYVVEGVLGHEVNGTAHRLEPGMLGFVKPGDAVRHAVLTDVPVRALVIWVPGGESGRLVEHAGFKVETVE
jgi:quercetin dioxygenase-like cupin family protein